MILIEIFWGFSSRIWGFLLHFFVVLLSWMFFHQFSLVISSSSVASESLLHKLNNPPLSLQVKENENLPSLICDLCIVQLNVAYNFKRLALENDFRLRQYLIENGMSVEKDASDTEEHQTTTNTTTALQIHQIDVIVDRSRTNHPRFREPDPPIRRNSTTSSASASTFFQTNREGNHTPSSAVNEVTNTVVLPKPIIRPIQIKIEPADDPIEETPAKTPSPSPASSTGSNSNISHISLTSIGSSSKGENRSPIPMVVIPSNDTSPASDRESSQKTSLDSSNKEKQTSTNATVLTTPSSRKVHSPNVISTRGKSKAQEDELAKQNDSLRNVRGLRPIQRKSLNERSLRKDLETLHDIDSSNTNKSTSVAKKGVENTIKSTSSKDDSTLSAYMRKKKALENFLKHVSSSMKIKETNKFPPVLTQSTKVSDKPSKTKEPKKTENLPSKVRPKETDKSKKPEKPKPNKNKTKQPQKEKSKKLKFKVKKSEKNSKNKSSNSSIPKKLGRPRKYQ